MAQMHEEKVYHVPYTAEQIEAAIGKGPIVIKTGNVGYWHVWDIVKMKYVDTGVMAYIGNIEDATKNADRAEKAAKSAEEAAGAVEEMTELAQQAADKAEEILNKLSDVRLNRGSWMQRVMFHI